MTLDFNALQAVIMDMDGVLWRSENPLNGMQEFITFLHEQEIPFALATNNSGKTRADYLAKFGRMDVHTIQAEQLVTSGTATASYLQANYPPQTPIYVIGMDGLRTTLSESGFMISQDEAEIVVVGIDFDFTYKKARHATLLINNGADFIGTNPDTSFPAPAGNVPGAGSLVQMIAAATDKDPVMIGKPAKAMFEVALDIVQSTPEHTLMIGDRLNTDIQGGHEVGMKTALVLSGVTSPDVVANHPIQADAVFDDLADLLTQWQNAIS